MKKVKALLIFLFFLLLIIFLITCFFTSPSSASNNNIRVSGYVKNTNGDSKEGVHVIVSNGSNEYPTTTDANGFYQIEVPSGNYIVKYDFASLEVSHKAKEISFQNSESYNGKLEIALIYNNQLDISSLENEIKGIINNENLRIIKNPYNNYDELNNMIKLLKQDSKQEHAFHKIGKANWKSIAIILSDKPQSDIIQYISNEHFSNDYRFIVHTLPVSVEDVMSLLNTELGLSSNQNQILDESSNYNNYAQTIQVTLDKNSIINVTLETTSFGTINFDERYPDYISGELLLENGQRIQDEVKVTLTNIEDTSYYGGNYFSGGFYNLAYPSKAGTYRIDFEFATPNVNGQYYEVVSDYFSVDSTTSTNQNTLNPTTTNTEELKKKFNTITYVEENQLNVGKETALTGRTDSFTVSDDPLNKKYAGAMLKEREKFILNVENVVTNYKLILNDGRILYDWNRDAHPDDSGIALGLFVLNIDEEIRHGSVLFAEYKITVYNYSNIDCDSYTLLNHCNFMYNENQTLLSSNQLNKDFGWKVISPEDVESLVGASNAAKFPTYLELEDKNGLPAKTAKEFYLTVSITLSNPPQFIDVAEIVKYQNIEGRRNYQYNSNNIVQAGNYINGATKEADTGIAELISVLPPFGNYDNNKLNILFIGGGFIIALLVILVAINEKSKSRKRHSY